MVDQGFDPLERLRKICLAFPEATERLSHGAPTFFVRGTRAFLSAWLHGHHADTAPHLTCAAPPGVQEALLEAEPTRFFRPPYVGHRGWIGVPLELDTDWDEIAEICEDAFRTVAPKQLVATLDAERKR